MPEQIFWLSVIALTVVAPLGMILSFITKWKSSKSLSAEEERTLEDLWQEGEALRDRIEVLENILDDIEPGWRRRT
ncbi:MAG TPA: envelope stress response membrane protein PspB [Gammaproteobacteria bacterium]|nr:envelope stress response membrane protein PspB [Gammaproteobacteria bacterium]